MTENPHEEHGPGETVYSIRLGGDRMRAIQSVFLALLPDFVNQDFIGDEDEGGRCRSAAQRAKAAHLICSM